MSQITTVPLTSFIGHAVCLLILRSQNIIVHKIAQLSKINLSSPLNSWCSLHLPKATFISSPVQLCLCWLLSCFFIGILCSFIVCCCQRRNWKWFYGIFIVCYCLKLLAQALQTEPITWLTRSRDSASTSQDRKVTDRPWLKTNESRGRDWENQRYQIYPQDHFNYVPTYSYVY